MKRIALLGAALALLLLAGPALGTTPRPIAIVNNGIQLAGQSAGIVDPQCELRIEVTSSIDGQPLPNSTVQILFTSCAGNDLHLATTQSFLGMAWDCAAQTAAAISNAQGLATFRLLGAASATPGNCPGLTTGCATVRVDGTLIAASVRVGAYDLDGQNGVNAADQSLFMGTLFAGPAGYRTRADYNGDGLCNSADLAKILSVQFTGGSAASAAPVCF